MHVVARGRITPRCQLLYIVYSIYWVRIFRPSWAKCNSRLKTWTRFKINPSPISHRKFVCVHNCFFFRHELGALKILAQEGVQQELQYISVLLLHKITVNEMHKQALVFVLLMYKNFLVWALFTKFCRLFGLLSSMRYCQNIVFLLLQHMKTYVF
jgi:hypothetical protein